MVGTRNGKIERTGRGCLCTITAAFVGTLVSLLACLCLGAMMPASTPGGHGSDGFGLLALPCVVSLGAFGGIVGASSKRLNRPIQYTAFLAAVAAAALFWFALPGGV